MHETHLLLQNGAISCIVVAVGLLSASGQVAAAEESDGAVSTVAVPRGFLEDCGRDDPFAPLVWNTSPKPPVPEKAKNARGAQDEHAGLPPLSLDGIIWCETLPQAIINETLVGVGDRAARRRVVSIDQDKVVLELDGKKETLRVEAVTFSRTTTRALPKE